MPEGFLQTDQVTKFIEADPRRVIPPPMRIEYNLTHTYQFRAHIYQARNLLPMDVNGLSSPFVAIIVNEMAVNTMTVKDDLNPIYAQTLITETFDICGTAEDVKQNPPKIIVELFHEDKGFGPPAYIGRFIVDSSLRLEHEEYETPRLKWTTIRRHELYGGEILAVFEFFQLAPEGVGDGTRENEMSMPESYAEAYMIHNDCEIADIPGVEKRILKPIKKYDPSFVPLPRSILPKRSWHRIEVTEIASYLYIQGRSCMPRGPGYVGGCGAPIQAFLVI